jgi:hypothetical protein
MTDVNSVPDWLGTAMAGAVIAALGYVAKLAIEGWSGWRRERAKRLRKLLELSSLLHASSEAYFYQRRLVDRLEQSLRVNHPEIAYDQSGFERHFAEAFGVFTRDEAELHGLIRSMTEHSFRPINQAMSAWLQSDVTYRTAPGAKGTRGQLAVRLNRLDTHLRLWHAKYEAWIPNHPQHALVYLADEEKHGIGFPPGLDDAVEKLLAELGANVPLKRQEPGKQDGAAPKGIL